MFRKLTKSFYCLTLLLFFLVTLSPLAAYAAQVQGYSSLWTGKGVYIYWTPVHGQVEVKNIAIPGVATASTTDGFNVTVNGMTGGVLDPNITTADIGQDGIRYSVSLNGGTPVTFSANITDNSTPWVSVTNFQAVSPQPGEINFSWDYSAYDPSQFDVAIVDDDGPNGAVLAYAGLTLGKMSYFYPKYAPDTVELEIAGADIQGGNPTTNVQSNFGNTNQTVQWSGFGSSWENNGVELGWASQNATGEAQIVRTDPDGNQAVFSQTIASNAFFDSSAQPNTKYTYTITAPNATPLEQTTTITTGAITTGSGSGGSGSGGTSGSTSTDLWDVFTPARWAITMSWYYTLAGLSGVFIFLVLVRSGYRYINSATNPGIKADFFADVQRCIIAVGLIAIAPLFVQALIGIDVGFVHLFANMVNAISNGGSITSPTGMPTASIFEDIIAAPFNLIKDIIQLIFGLPSLDQLIFNGTSLTNMGGMFGSSSIFQTSFNTGNVLANAILNLSMLGFTVYFSALYTIRRWVIIATLASTPIIVWVWVLTEEKQVLEIWAAEIVSTIFMQLFQALSLGIFISVLNGNLTSAKTLVGVGLSTLSSGLQGAGIWLASLGGVMCLFALVILGYKLMVSGNAKTRAEIKLGIGRAIIGMGILGLSLEFAGFLVFVLNSPVGQIIQAVKTAIGV